MELITSGVLVSTLVVLLGGLVCSFVFTDNSSNTKSTKSTHLAGHKKILTQDGMIVRKTSLDKPLFLMGDSKVIRKT